MYLPASPTAATHSALPRVGSSNYWDSDAWDPDNRIYVGAAEGMTHHRIAVTEEATAPAVAPPALVVPAASTTTTAEAAPTRSAGSSASPAVVVTHPPIVRVNSYNYWGSDAWDADNRVYVGASNGVAQHRIAVQPDDATKQAAVAVGASTAPVGTVAPTTQTVVGTASASPAAVVTRPAFVRLDSSNYWNSMQPQASKPQLPVAAVLQASTTSRVTSPPATTVGHMTVGYQVQVLQSPQGRNDGGSPKSSNGSAYWDMGGWETGRGDAFVRNRMGGFSVARVGSQNLGGATPTGAQPSPKIARVNSNAYWDAEQWDPDERVYTGAEIGQKNHLRAVDPKSEKNTDAMKAEIVRAWSGGLVSRGLGLGTEVGPPLDVPKSGECHPTLQELYEVRDRSVGRPAEHRTSKTACVVKTVSKAAAGDQYRLNLVDGLLGERLLRMSCDKPHPNVTRYFDLLESPKQYFVVMEELSGPELLQQVEEMFPATEAYLQLILKQVLGALHHLHDNVGLYHRDVKLSNFRYRTHEEGSDLVLLDFGFAGSTSDVWDKAACGTMMFMAPEVHGSTAQTPHLAAMDVWAVGVILYVLLTGDAPVQDNQVKLLGKPDCLEEAQRILDRALQVPELAQASDIVKDLVRKLLVIDPKARISAARALEHPWFTAEGLKEPLAVSSAKYRLVRSASRTSEVRKPPLRRVTSTGSSIHSPKKSPSSDDLFIPEAPFRGGLERINSDGVDNLEP